MVVHAQYDCIAMYCKTEVAMCCSPLYTVYTAGYDLFRQDCKDHGIRIKDATPAGSSAQKLTTKLKADVGVQ
jgi:hypothetical protein